MMSHLIFDVKVCSGLAENLNDARESVPRCDVQTRLFVLRMIMPDAEADDDADDDGEADAHCSCKQMIITWQRGTMSIAKGC